MAVHSLRQIQCIPAPLQKVWDFFIDPGNLASITPPYMRFQPLPRDNNNKIYPGQIIEYRLRPFPWLGVYWMTEIAHVQPLSYFIDVQRRGPYRLWHHQHHFREMSDGVEMTDIVHYEVPLGFIGNWVNELTIRRQLEGIFQYRRRRIGELFTPESVKYISQSP